jgi:hypothetical protein
MRALRILLIIAVILGGFFVAADRIAVNMAESEAADRITFPQGTVGSTEVSIKGFPFLTQVAGKELDEVGITLTGIEANAAGHRVRVGEMSADLFQVRLEGGGYFSATAARAEGTARISYADLTKAAGDGITIPYGDNGKVKVPGEGVPGLEDLIREKTDFDRRIGELSAGLKLEKVEAKPDGVVITVSGKDIALAG